MPLYEYECTKCGHRFEHLAKNSSEKPDCCPKCGAKKPERRLSSFSASTGSGGTGSGDAGSCTTGTCPFG